jgi:hypothetical protein
MHKRLIKPHNTTTNVYVQREILTKNISQLNSYLASFKLSGIKSRVFREARADRDSQHLLLKKLNKKIAMREQLDFRFGSTL